MKTLLLIAAGLLAAPVPAQDATKDKTNIEGTWEVMSAVREGKPRDDIKGDKLIFKDGKLTIKNMKKKKDENGTYKLDPGKKPKTIDLTQDGSDKTLKGIYELKGDKLTICVSPPDSERPDKFESLEGGKTMIIELTRSK
jgi:uncharacterized protein (TIGR03067 family)